MKKLAIYVEGQTEQIFVSKLVKEIAGKNNIVVLLEKLHGGNKYARSITTIEAKNTKDEEEYYVLIRDCGCDNKVQSDIKDNIESHSKNGFDKVIGLRDVYPFKKEELKKLITYSATGIPTKFIPFKIIFAVMEVESWFLGDENHFNVINENLTPQKIEASLNLELTPTNIENLEQPAVTLNEIYNLVGFSYDKSYETVQKVVNSLDMENMYVSIKDELKSLGLFIDEIDNFITP